VLGRAGWYSSGIHGRMRPAMPRAPHSIPGAHAAAIAATVAAVLLAGCARQPAALEQIRARGQLRVVTLNSPTTYYLGAHGPQGLEYRLAQAFAAKLGVGLAMQPVRDAAGMREVLAAGGADLAAAQITAGDDWKPAGLIATTYEDVPQLVIQGRGKPPPHNIASLHGARIVVRAGSPQLALLRQIQGNGVPELSWTELPPDEADPLDWVNNGDADYAIIDASVFAFAQHLYPELNAAFTLPDPRPVQWVVRLGAFDLRSAVASFFSEAHRSGELARIEQQAGAEAQGFEYLEARQFQADIARRLPELQAIFQEAARTTGLDWRLLAAVGYQESKWQSDAESANGALGIMMLTTDAATAVGVTDRSNLRQNIVGGAKYLAQVIDTIPKRIAEPDRTWFGLASYNVGYGHLEDARVLAQIRGKNPDSWEDVREQLPLLAEEKWYTRVKRGYARGWEPAKFVEQVRQFLAVLEWIDAAALARSSGQPRSTSATAATPAP
jgi:membrane-bound lytic murein transglycosylase F